MKKYSKPTMKVIDKRLAQMICTSPQTLDGGGKQSSFTAQGKDRFYDDDEDDLW